MPPWFRPGMDGADATPRARRCEANFRPDAEGAGHEEHVDLIGRVHEEVRRVRGTQPLTLGSRMAPRVVGPCTVVRHESILLAPPSRVNTPTPPALPSCAASHA